MSRLIGAAIAGILLLGCGSDSPPMDFDPPPPDTDPPALNVNDYITGLDKPWDVTWTPGGEMLFTEHNTGDV